MLQKITFLRSLTRINDRLSPSRNTTWMLFWDHYMCCTFDRHRFTQNYVAAWRKKMPDHIITIFINNGSRIDVPSPDPINMDDEKIIRHVKLFHSLNLFRNGVMRALIPKALSNVDIVEVE